MKTSKNIKRVILVVLIVVFIAAIICGGIFIAKELSKNNYFNIDRKITYFIKNEDVFTNSLNAVLNGNTDELEIVSVENGIVSYSSDDVLKKHRIKSVSGKNSVIDYILSSALYESGYLYCTDSENVFPVSVDDTDLSEEIYVGQEDGTLVKGSYKEQKSYSENWLVIKQINDNWYYYEYHNNSFK